MQWLGTKNIKDIKYFRKNCEWKQLVNKHSDMFHVKENDNKCKAHEKIKIILKTSMIKKNKLTKQKIIGKE